jgi:hypothetical protein
MHAELTPGQYDVLSIASGRRRWRWLNVAVGAAAAGDQKAK